MAKRKKLRIKPSGLIFLGILLAGIFGLIYFTTDLFKSDNSNLNQSTDSNNNIFNFQKKDDEKKDQTYKLSLLATGDGLIHSVIYKSYEEPNGTFNFTKALEEVKDIVSKYDIAYYNQETPLGDSSLPYSGYPLFYTPEEYGKAMLDIGFNTVSLASNHSLDKGEKGILNSLNYWETTDALIHGMARSTDQRNITIKEKNNIKYTMLSYTEMTNGLNIPSGKNYLINVYNKEQVKKDIEEVRDKVDVLIVAMHWGIEYLSTPTEKQIEMAEYLASLGVDIIIGNHPHVLEPITKINNTIVMYSLGNFISNQYGTDDWNKLVGFMATLDITKTVSENNTTITIDNLGGELIFTHYIGNPITTASHSNHKVIPFSKMYDETYLKDYKRVYEKYSNVLQSMGTNLNIAPLPN